jgi:hypothetical protein
MDAKACAKCKQVLSLDRFSPHRRMRDGRQSYCKPCARTWHHEHKDYVVRKNAAWKKANPDYARDHWRLRQLGASKEWVVAQIEKQGNKCAGCEKSFVGHREHVDHCHKTGTLRGLLCRECNLALGYVRDSEATLTRLAAYIARQEAEAH